MKKLYLAQLFVLLCLTVAAQKQVALWGEHFGGKGWDVVNGLTVDAKDNVYLTGSYTDSVHNKLGRFASKGKRDAFVAKCDKSGKLVWFKTLGGQGHDNGIDIISNKKGFIFLSMHIEDTVEYAGRKIKNQGKSVLLACLDKDGNFRWSKTIKGRMLGLSGLSQVNGSRLALAGNFEDSLIVEGKRITPHGKKDGFVILTGLNGKLYSVSRVGGPEYDLIQSMDTDPQGNIILGGITASCDIYPPGNRQKGNIKNIFLKKYDWQMQAIWDKQLTGTGYQKATVVKAAPDGSIFLSGVFYGKFYFGNTELITRGLEDVFLAKFSAEGETAWHEHIGSASRDLVGSLTVTRKNDVVITVNYKHELNIGDASFKTVNEDNNIILTKFDSEGRIKTAQQFGAHETEYCKGIIADSENNLYMTGAFNRVTRIKQNTMISHGEKDVFVARLIDCENRMYVFSDSIILCGDETQIELPEKLKKRYSGKKTEKNRLKLAGKEQINVLVTDSLGCEVTDTVFIERAPLPEVDLGPDMTINMSDQVVLIGGQGHAKYTWSNNTTESQLVVGGNKKLPGSYTYTLEVENEYGCVNRDSVIIQIKSELDQQAEGLNVFPNPVRDVLFWSLNIEQPASLIIKLVDTKGRILHREEIDDYYPGEVKNIRVSNYMGLATLHISGGGITKTRKIIIQ